MGLFRKKPSKEYENEWNFTCKCMEELMDIRKTGTTEELIGLQMTNPDEYIEWRKQNPNANPRAFFYRPGAQENIQAMRKGYEDLALLAREAVELQRRKK